MQESRKYTGDRAPVKPQSVQRVACRICTRSGVVRLAGSIADVLGWMRAQCPTGKIAEIAEVRA